MTSSKLASYPWYPRDALTDFEKLSADGELVSRRLLDFQWLEGALPADTRDLANLCRKLSAARWRRAWAEVAETFPVTKSDATKRQNHRLERVRREVLGAIDRASRRGRAGAQARWKDSESTAQAPPGHSSANAQAMATNTNTKEYSTTTARARDALPEDYRDDFDRLVRSANAPESVAREVLTLTAGKAMVAEGATPEDVGRGIRDLLLNGAPPAKLGRYVRVVRDSRTTPLPPARPRPDDEDEFARAGRRIDERRARA